jgi:hypothetical protein
MSIIIDSERGKKVAKLLYEVFTTSGIFGKKEMPEDILPMGMRRGSPEHLLFITLTVAIDYQRDAEQLWESARKTFEDPETRYLFDPESIYKTPLEKIKDDMQKYKLSKKPEKDSKIWKTLGTTFYKKWGGNPLNLLEDCGWDSVTILKRLKDKDENKKTYYPYLSGPKIGPLWLRMLRDNVGILQLRNLEKVTIPVDIHVARATLTPGVIRGEYRCKLNELREHIRNVWFESVKGLRVKNREMIALDVDEPLWHLSRYGCRKRDKITGDCPRHSECVAKKFCVKGMIKIEGNIVEVNTREHCV